MFLNDIFYKMVIVKGRFIVFVLCVVIFFFIMVLIVFIYVYKDFYVCGLVILFENNFRLVFCYIRIVFLF